LRLFLDYLGNCFLLRGFAGDGFDGLIEQLQVLLQDLLQLRRAFADEHKEGELALDSVELQLALPDIDLALKVLQPRSPQGYLQTLNELLMLFSLLRTPVDAPVVLQILIGLDAEVGKRTRRGEADDIFFPRTGRIGLAFRDDLKT
jgi:hypothetical protein